MFWCHHHNPCGCCELPYCPFPEWKHPLLCNPAHLCCAENENGPTLVIHQILLEPCGNQSCTPRTFTIRITGPSYPCGETFTLRAGSCTQSRRSVIKLEVVPSGRMTLREASSQVSKGWAKQDSMEHRRTQTFLRLRVILGAGRVYW